MVRLQADHWGAITGLLLLVFVGSVNAVWSQDPPQSPRVNGQVEQPQSAPNEQNAGTDQRGTAAAPLFVKILPAHEDHADSEQEERERHKKAANERGLTLYTGLLALFTALLVLVALGQAGLFVWQLILIKRGAKNAETAANAALEQAKAITLSERAYVHLSHKSPPGLDIRVAEGKAAIRVEVKNSGKTPAHVTDVLLKLAVDKLPAATDGIRLPDDHRVTRAFLVTGGTIFHSTAFTADPDVWNAVREEAISCWIYGYVDYVDVFKVRRRGGYMRKFDRWDNAAPEVIPGVPIERSNNLIFDPVPGFNYDRPRKPGEGNDWNEELG